VLAWLLPMTHLIAVLRPLTTGAPLHGGLVVLHLAYIMLLALGAFLLARHRFGQRLFD